ncbi:hypothetical protein [Sediminicola arcticus]|uniref:Uncharacterized protein n=1 Tax=Sediminicola arcticus TaxID=1574308 RepID=A0ABV2ST81_9FLAO
MPLNTNSVKNNLNSRIDNNYQVVGIESFEKDLAKYFFSEVAIKAYSSTYEKTCLNIEFQNNLTLSEVLCFLNTHTWQDKKDKTILKNINPFLKTLQSIKDKNSFSIDIEEVSILLKDTSIVIKKIYAQSIPNQLENILKEITESHFRLTRNFNEVPFEIFIPVFEEDPLEKNDALENIRIGSNNSANDYFGYWGLYYDSEAEAVIYDLENKSMVYGDLFMLNH